MKKTILLLLVILVTFIAGCNVSPTSEKPPVPQGLSAEDTVKLYFEYYNNKDKEGMNSLKYKKIQNTDAQLQKLNYIKLISCSSESDAASLDFNIEWYKTPHAIASVVVEFETDYQGGWGAGLSNGVHKGKYYLVKESEESNWIIVKSGLIN